MGLGFLWRAPFEGSQTFWEGDKTWSLRRRDGRSFVPGPQSWKGFCLRGLLSQHPVDPVSFGFASLVRWWPLHPGHWSAEALRPQGLGYLLASLPYSCSILGPCAASWVSSLPKCWCSIHSMSLRLGSWFFCVIRSILRLRSCICYSKLAILSTSASFLPCLFVDEAFWQVSIVSNRVSTIWPLSSRKSLQLPIDGANWWHRVLTHQDGPSYFPLSEIFLPDPTCTKTANSIDVVLVYTPLTLKSMIGG